MPRGKRLSVEEQAKIIAYADAGLSTHQISKKLNRSQTVICNFLKLKENYGKNGKYDGNTKLKPKQKRRILHEASKNKLFSSQIVEKLELPVTSRRVRQILAAEPNLVYKKRMKKPPLTAIHRSARLNFARKYMHWTTEWHKVLFSDEKKFNLDGPDGCQYYWHDKRLQEEIQISRVSGGGSVMIWAGFAATGKTNLAWVPPKMNSEKYIELLEAVMVERAEELCGVEFVFQQDNAAIHTGRVVKEWFAETNISVLDWPARSPDLNPMENLWGILVRRVYANGKQYQSVDELKTAIKTTWALITQAELEKLINSMPDRIFQVIQRNGGPTKY